MLNIDAYAAASATAEMLAAKGKKIVSLPGTPLAGLVGLSDQSWLGTLQTKVDGRQYVDASTGKDLNSVTMHDKEMGALITQIASVVRQHVGYARNTVKPLVLQLQQEYEAYIPSISAKDPASEFEIRLSCLPEVLLDEVFLESLTYYKDRKAVKPEAALGLPVPEAGKIVQDILTGHERTDKIIAGWASHKSAEYFTDIFQNTFGSKDAGMYWFDSQSGSNPYVVAEENLVIYLLANKYYNDIQDANRDLASYRKIVTQMRDYSGAMLVNTLKRISISAASGVLVIGRESDKVLNVNQQAYSKWIEEGNHPEVLLGMMVSGDFTTTVAGLEKNKASYLRQWESYETFYRSREKNQESARRRQFLTDNCARMLGQMDCVEADVSAKITGHCDVVARRVYQELMALSDQDLRNSALVALILVAKCRFYYTPAYQILRDIAEAGSINPDVDVREAALLAVINYVSDYLAAQMAVIDDPLSA